MNDNEQAAMSPSTGTHRRHPGRRPTRLMTVRRSGSAVLLAAVVAVGGTAVPSSAHHPGSEGGQSESRWTPSGSPGHVTDSLVEARWGSHGLAGAVSIGVLNKLDALPLGVS